MNVLNLKIKKIETQYQEFYKNGRLNLNLDIVYKNELHKTKVKLEQKTFLHIVS